MADRNTKLLWRPLIQTILPKAVTTKSRSSSVMLTDTAILNGFAIVSCICSATKTTLQNKVADIHSYIGDFPFHRFHHNYWHWAFLLAHSSQMRVQQTSHRKSCLLKYLLFSFVRLMLKTTHQKCPIGISNLSSWYEFL